MTDRMIEGPFKDLPAEVIDRDPETGELTVLVSIFGRVTPVRIPPEALGGDGGDGAGDREPRAPHPIGGNMAAAVDPDA